MDALAAGVNGKSVEVHAWIVIGHDRGAKIKPGILFAPTLIFLFGFILSRFGHQGSDVRSSHLRGAGRRGIHRLSTA